MKTYDELLAETKARVKEISVADAKALHASDRDVVFLDIREPAEYNLAKIAGAITQSRGNLESKIEGLVPREKRIVVYCANGNRSAFGAEVLGAMGYERVESLRGGFNGWIAEGGEVE
jgi:rhodanese-related sulfurtransferase